MPRVLIPLANGCEELEAVTIIDLLRRAEIEVITAGLESGAAPVPITASRGVVLVPDCALDSVLNDDFDMIVLPGGLPGADYLAADARITALLQRQAAAGRYCAAICAAPKVLAGAGVLAGKQATFYPGAVDQSQYPAFQALDAPVVVDGAVITSRGPGTALDFALQLIETLVGTERRQAVEQALVRP